STTSLPVTVLGPNTDPVASFSSSVSGLTATVDGTASSDEDGSIQSYEWDWGDGSAPGTDALASHTYGAAGSYAVTLTVTDDRDGNDSVTHQVEVTHADPVAVFDVVASGTSVTTDAAASTASDGATLEYSWDWGD